MATIVKNIDKFHAGKRGKIILGSLEVILAYTLISLAFDSGAIWQYFLAILLLIGGVNNLINAAKKPSKR